MQSGVAGPLREVDREVVERSAELGSDSIASGPFLLRYPSCPPASHPGWRSYSATAPFLVRLLPIFRRYLYVGTHAPPHDIDYPPALTVIE